MPRMSNGRFVDWSDPEKETLITGWNAGKTDRDLMLDLPGRSEQSIAQQRRKMNLPFRERFQHTNLSSGQLRSGPGLPPGHLMPWPDHSPFFEDEPRAMSSGIRVARCLRAEPVTSAGVAQYG